MGFIMDVSILSCLENDLFYVNPVNHTSYLVVYEFSWGIHITVGMTQSDVDPMMRL